jgi:hypothetical protein
MQRLGLLLMWLGAAVGALVALGLGANELPLFHLGLHGLSWWIALGAVKLTLLGSVGLIAVGATLRRLGRRQNDRLLPERDSDETTRIGDG